MEIVLWKQNIYHASLHGKNNMITVQRAAIMGDFKRGVNFLEDKAEDTAEEFRSDVLYFRKLYQFGHEYAKKGYDYECLKLLCYLKDDQF